ncbi:hypothetical protein Tco_0429683 [Tanacetum coccineum]
MLVLPLVIDVAAGGFLNVGLCLFELSMSIRLFRNAAGMVTPLGCGLEWFFFFRVFRNGVNLFQVEADVHSEAEEKYEDDAEYI